MTALSWDKILVVLSIALNIWIFGQGLWGDTTTVEMGKIAYKYPEKSVLTYLKKNGVVLTPEQEKMRKE